MDVPVITPRHRMQNVVPTNVLLAIKEEKSQMLFVVGKDLVIAIIRTHKMQNVTTIPVLFVIALPLMLFVL